MKRGFLFLLLGTALAACNSAGLAPDTAAPAAASIRVTPPGFQLPSGGGCAGEIARYRAIQDNDLAMGHVAQSVYDQIHGEIASAEKSCAAGRDGEARALVLASRQRHGYPTQL